MALNSKNNDVHADFQFLDIVVCSTESKMCCFECAKCNEIVDTFFHCQRALNFINGNEMRTITLRKHWTMVIMVRFLICLKHSFEGFWFIRMSKDYSSNTLNHCMIILVVRKFWFKLIFEKNFPLQSKALYNLLIGRIISAHYSLCIYRSTKM